MKHIFKSFIEFRFLLNSSYVYVFLEFVMFRVYFHKHSVVHYSQLITIILIINYLLFI